MQDLIIIFLQKSPTFPTKKKVYKIPYKFLHVGQNLIQLKLTSMALGFIKVMESVA